MVVVITHVDDGNNRVSNFYSLGLEGVQGCLRVFGSCDQRTQVQGLRSMHY
jgi:hypothetical protein